MSNVIGLIGLIEKEDLQIRIRRLCLRAVMFAGIRVSGEESSGNFWKKKPR